jgi:hypothetical protein
LLASESSTGSAEAPRRRDGAPPARSAACPRCSTNHFPHTHRKYLVEPRDEINIGDGQAQEGQAADIPQA